MTSPPDFLTVLECTERHRCAKRYTDPAEKPEAYDAGILFRVESVPVASLAELAEALDGLRLDARCMVIRDRLKADATPNPKGLYLRRRVDRPGDPAPFEHAPHRWAMFDADDTPAPFDPKDPKGSVERWRAKLPAPLRRCGMVFQFSASQHLSPTVRGHAWVWLDEPLGNATLARWSTRHGLDPAPFHAVQPHYTADPVFVDSSDPLHPRALVVLGGPDCSLDLAPEDRLPDNASAGQRVSSVDVDELPPPRDDARAIDTRRRITRQLESAFSGPGKRWDLCGLLGGACANAGVPPEECLAILEDLDAGGLSEAEAMAGARWALGAWQTTAKPKGVSGVAELLGAPTADKIGGLLESYAREFAPEPEDEALEQAAPASPWGALPLEDFSHDAEPEPIEWLCEALQIGPGKPSGLVSYANNSKTPWGLEFALFVSAPKLAGKAFQGVPITRQGRALVLVCEGARNARRKLSKICRGHGVDFKNLKGNLTITQGPPGFLSVDAAAELGEQAVAQGYKLVVIDTYNSADGSKDRNTAEFSLALKVLGDISDRNDVTFLVLLHTRKGDPKNQHRQPTLQDIDGHNSIAGALQSAVGLWRPTEDRHVIGVCCVREVDEAFPTYQVKWTDTPGEGLRAELHEETAGASEGSAVDPEERDRVATRLILKMAHATGSTTWNAISRAPLGIAKGTARQALVRGLVADGILTETVHGVSVEYAEAPITPRVAQARARRGL